MAKIEIFNQSGTRVLEENLLSSDSWIVLPELSTGIIFPTKAIEILPVSQ